MTKFKSLSQLIGENNEQMNSLKSNSAHLVEQVQRSQRLNRGEKSMKFTYISSKPEIIK